MHLYFRQDHLVIVTSQDSEMFLELCREIDGLLRYKIVNFRSVHILYQYLYYFCILEVAFHLHAQSPIWKLV